MTKLHSQGPNSTLAHRLASLRPDVDTLNYSSEELCHRIKTLTSCIMAFWKESIGWAPASASYLLDNSKLEWQASLSSSLARWLEANTLGDLILAWTNLGALVEGQLKLFLCVHYNDYQADVRRIEKKGKLIAPDECTIKPLREFFETRIWNTGINWSPYVQFIQERRNAIHAFKFRQIGTFDEWQDALRFHLTFVRDVGGRLPYPDDYFSGLVEK